MRMRGSYYLILGGALGGRGLASAACSKLRTSVRLRFSVGL